MSELIMTYQDAFTLLTAIQQLKVRVKADKVIDSKLFYCITKNEKALLNLAKRVNDEHKVSPEYMIFNQDRAKLAAEYSNKDEKGFPVILTGEQGQYYDIPLDKKPEFEAKVLELKEKNAEIIDKQEINEQKMFAKMELVIPAEEFEPYKIKVDQLGDVITMEEMEKLFWIIEE